MTQFWADEIHEDGYKIGLRASRMLFSQQSDFQKVEIIETTHYGNALRLDDIWMCAEKLEHTYHEMISHPALCSAPKIEDVLIIGGGDGGTAREVLRHPEVKNVDMVEIDGMVVDACKEFLPTIGTSWSDPRLNLIIGDGIAHVRDSNKIYDIIIVDGSDPVGPAEGLFNEAFFRDCARTLSAEGVISVQGEGPLSMNKVHVALIQTMEKIFANVNPYYQGLMIYPGGEWSWIYASNQTQFKELNLHRVALIEETSRIYNRDVHMGAFAIPNHVRKALGRTFT
jgi:spermidine synthase